MSTIDNQENSRGAEWGGKIKYHQKNACFKAGQFNQIWQMVERKALMQKTNYYWQGSDVA